MLSKSLEATGWYTCVSDIHRPVEKKPAADATSVLKDAKQKLLGGEDDEETSADYIAGLPVVSFRFSDKFKAEFPHIKQEPVSLLMRARQWIIPNYALPPNEDKIEILRVVVRETMSFDLLDRLISDLVTVTQTLMENDAVDLDILQGSKAPGMTNPVKDHDRKKHPHHGTKHKGPRLADGIHRAVC